MPEWRTLRYASLYLGKGEPSLNQYLGSHDPVEDITEPVPLSIREATLGGMRHTGSSTSNEDSKTRARCQHLFADHAERTDQFRNAISQGLIIT